MNKWYSIQALRGIGIIAVVANHLQSIERKYSGGYLMIPDLVRIGQSAVDLFFVISGFVMVIVTRGHFGNRTEMVRFLWGRASRVYPVYWFYYFLTLAVFLAKPSWVNTTQGHKANLLSSFLLIPDERLPLVMVAWSLIHEVWFYLVFAVILLFRERFLLPFLLAWGTVIITVNLLADPGIMSHGLRLVSHPYTLEFIAGALVAIFTGTHYAGKVSSAMAWTGIAIVFFIVLPLTHVFNVPGGSSLVRASIFGVFYSILLVSMVVLEKQAKLPIPKILGCAGDISYTVYLSHILVLSAIGRLRMAIFPPTDNPLFNFLVLLFMFVAVFVYGWVGYRLVELPVTQISHRLRSQWFGGKKQKGTARLSEKTI